MSKLVIGGLFMLVLTAPAFAGCEDGAAMAEDAAVKAAAKVGGRCRASEISDPEDTRTGEAFVVTVKCTERNYTYRVTLREIEDAVCTVTKVELASPGTRVVPGKLKCPRPGTTINCMPVTTNPSCRKENRAWITANCSGVRWLD